MNSIDTKKLTLLPIIFLFFSPFVLAGQNQTAEPDSTDKIQEIIMERITVVGSPVWMSQIPGAANYISPQQLQKQGYTDINRVLRSVSGVNLQEEDGFGLRPNIGLRGAGVERSTKINLMEDGVLAAPAPYSAPAAYYFPNIGRINSVEVRKGSSQIKYGPNTTGGAINLISTPIPAEMTGNAELSVGEKNASKLYTNFGNTYENFGFVLEALQMSNDGFKELDNGGNTGFNIRDFMGKFMVRTNSDASVYQRLELKAGYNDQTSDETYLGLTRQDFQSNPFRRYAASQVDQMKTEHVQLMARHFALFSENVDLTTTLYRNTFSREWYKLHDLNTSLDQVNMGNLSRILQDPSSHSTELGYLQGNTSPDDALNVRSNAREYYSQGVETILGLNFDTGAVQNQIEFGVRFHKDEEDRFQFDDLYRMENGIMVLTTSGIPGTQDNRIGSARALSFFLQDKMTFSSFTFTPGVRFENIWFKNINYGRNDVERTGSDLVQNEYTISEFIPGFGLTYAATDQITLISGIHKGFSPPSPGSSSETRSEQSINYELGFRFADALVQTEVIGFYNDYSNLLGSDLAAGGGSGTTAQFNAGEVRVFGLEVSANADIADLISSGSISIPLNLNYTYTNATFQTDFESNFGPWGTVVKGDKIPFIPNHQFNAGISVNHNRLSVNLNSVISPQMRTVSGSGSLQNEFSTDSYFLLDANTTYQVTSSLSAFLNVRNILDETYIVSDRPAGVRPGLPRTAMGGIRITL